MNNMEARDILQNLSPEERSLALKILGEVTESGSSLELTKLFSQDYTEIPVDIDTFLDDPQYAGWFTNNGKDVYPYWRQKLREIFEDGANYSEIAITGSIGTGKSHVTIMALAYCLYKLMCLRDPHGYYGIAKGGYIYVVFFNATLALSQGVAYTKFQSLLQNSPWFLERGKVTGTKYLEYVPNGPIRFTVGSQMEHSIGKDILFGIMDEVNFVKGASLHMEQSKIMKTYSSVLERINSRFIVRGQTMGKLFLVSSKKSEHDFVESYIEKQKGKPGVFIIDAKLWEVKPSGTYSGKTFPVAIGGSNMPSRVIQDGEDLEFYKRQGFKILDVPIEFKSRFEMDIQVALMNIAGISISNVTKFITYDNLSKCFISDPNPWATNVVTLGMKDPLVLKDFFKPELVEPDLTTKPLFIHIDTSLTGDRTGIGCIAVMGMKYQNNYDIATNEYVPTKELVYRHVFSVAIQCPNGDEISFQKTRDFLYYLKYVLGWNIKGISLDGYQSADSKQLLITMGFDAVILSLDRSPEGYLTTKSAINEKRVGVLNIPELSEELINLERDNRSGKIDHPVDGRKDMSDGFSGALANATNHRGDLDLYLLEDAEVIMSTNPDEVMESENILKGLVPDITRISDLESIGPDIMDSVSLGQMSIPAAPQEISSGNDYAESPMYEDDIILL